jgi:hypothetical protein
VLVVEAWSGIRLPVPDEPDEASLSALAEIAAIIRAEGMRVRFTSEITGVTTGPADKANRLVLHEQIDRSLWDVWVPLGQVDYDVRVRVISSVAAEAGRFNTRFEPQTDWLWAPLTPPTTAASERVRMIQDGFVPDYGDPGSRSHPDASRRAESW